MTAYIGVGANIDPLKNIRSALERLMAVFSARGVSTFYVTEPLAGREQPAYVNGVFQIHARVPPMELRRVLKRIEKDLGRERGSDAYASRTIDLDIAIYGNTIVHNDTMNIPDPHLRDRPFLCLPIYELDATVVLPDTGERIADIAGSLRPVGMKPLPDFTVGLRRMIEREQTESTRAH